MIALKKLNAVMATLALALGVSALASQTRAADTNNLVAIFNGKDLSGWKAPIPNLFWQVVDGVLVGENDAKLTGHVLHTDQSYTNFVLELEVRWTGEIDSGVMLREPELQVQFGISRSLQRDMTGSFYLAKTPAQPAAGYPEAGRAKNVDKLFKPGGWNKVRLLAQANGFTVWLNEELVSHYTDARYAGGAPLGLQIHPGLKMKVEFRNLRAAALD